MNTQRPLAPGEVIMETVSISDTGIALIILEGQLTEADRYFQTLRQRRARPLSELRELEGQIDAAQATRDRTEQYIRNAARAVVESTSFTYDLRKF